MQQAYMLEDVSLVVIVGLASLQHSKRIKFFLS